MLWNNHVWFYMYFFKIFVNIYIYIFGIIFIDYIQFLEKNEGAGMHPVRGSRCGFMRDPLCIEHCHGSLGVERRRDIRIPFLEEICLNILSFLFAPQFCSLLPHKSGSISGVHFVQWHPWADLPTVRPTGVRPYNLRWINTPVRLDHERTDLYTPERS